MLSVQIPLLHETAEVPETVAHSKKVDMVAGNILISAYVSGHYAAYFVSGARKKEQINSGVRCMPLI